MEQSMGTQLSDIAFRYIRWDSPIGWSVAGAAALGALAWPAGSTSLWMTFFQIAAGLCGSSYRMRCGRVHCRITGPLFLLCAVYLATVQLNLVPFIGNTWFLVGVLGTVVLSFMAELVVGTTVGS